MGEKYSENLVNRELARSIGDFFDKASTKLPYSKGYRAKVLSGSNGAYKIEINGVEHSLKTDFVLRAGQLITVLSLQNQNGDYVLIPAAEQIEDLGYSGGGSSEYETYTGAVTVTPKPNQTTVLNTRDKVVNSDITVLEIPYYSTSNLAGGNTVYIGGN